MESYVALYRGINVGGKNLVKMALLRAMHEGLGHGDVSSYLQSGNVLFSAAGSADRIARKIASEFEKVFGFSPKVMVVPAARWGAIARNNPYAKFSMKNPNAVHACVCDGEPSEKGLEQLLRKTGGAETFVVKGSVIYVHTPDGFGTSKFAVGMEKACGVPVTARNWRTMEALWRMLDDRK